MDPFNRSNLIPGNFQGPANNLGHQNTPNPQIIDVNPQWGNFYPDGKPSWFERLIGKGNGVITKLAKTVMAFALLATVFCLLGPFLRFLFHFSSWLTEVIDNIFF